MVKIMLVGNVPPQCDAVFWGLVGRGDEPILVPHKDRVTDIARLLLPDLIIVAGWRHLIPPEVLAIAPTVGFHSAKLPEYPGRAPVPWTLVRGDSHAYNTMLFLDEGVDSGDIIDQESRPIEPGDTPATLYEWIAESNVRMLLRHLPALKEGRAPRTPQDPALRGPLTSKDGWQVYENLTRREYAHG
jgi:methionyl-tRNA formyltransferase